jgi:outer membrane protein
MKNRIILFILLLAGVVGRAQAPADTLALTLDQAVALAVEQNPQLLRTRLDEEANRLRIREIKASALPQVNGDASYTDNYALPTQLLPGEFFGQPGGTIPVQFGTRNNLSATVQVTQSLFNKQIAAGLRAATASQKLYELNTFRTKEDLVYQVAQLYLQLQITQRQDELLQANLARANRLIGIAEAQLKEGVIKKIDVDQMRVNQTNLVTQRFYVQNGYDQQVNVLKILLGLPVETPVAVTDSLGTLGAQLTATPAFEPQQNTSLRLLDVQQSLLNIERQSFQAGYYPTLAAFAQYGWQGQSQKLFDADRMNSFTSGAWGLRLSVPIFDGLAKQQKIEQNRVRSSQLALDRQYATSNLQAQFTNARNRLAQNQAVLDAQQANMRLAEELYNTSNLAYTEGVAPLTELINAENGLTNAQTQYITALLQTQLAGLDLMKYSGALAKSIN